MKRGKTYISIFTKSVIAFLVLGFLPFMLISLAVFSRNIQSVAKSAIDNSYKTTRGIRDDIQELLEDIGEYSKYLYEYESNDYGYFYEILTDAGISDVLRENLVEDALKQILFQKHIEKVYVSEIRQKEAQLNALAAQIQPHYLYNTLDSIRMSAITNDDQDTALMLESLSAQMRYLSSDNRSLVSLKEALDNLQDYFNIIRIRYENAVQLEMNVGDDTLMCRMPRLTLQPLVENSVKHGIAPKGEGLVAVYAERKQDSLEVMVIDDGVGMDGKALEEINGVLDGKPARQGKWEKSTGIGLKNIEERIKLQFGEGYGLCLSSKEGLGTVVRCRLPIYDQEGEAE